MVYVGSTLGAVAFVSILGYIYYLRRKKLARIAKAITDMDVKHPEFPHQYTSRRRRSPVKVAPTPLNYTEETKDHMELENLLKVRHSPSKVVPIQVTPLSERYKEHQVKRAAESGGYNLLGTISNKAAIAQAIVSVSSVSAANLVGAEAVQPSAPTSTISAVATAQKRLSAAGNPSVPVISTSRVEISAPERVAPIRVVPPAQSSNMSKYLAIKAAKAKRQPMK